MVDSFKEVRVDTAPPEGAAGRAPRPNVLSPVPGGARRVRVAYSGPRNVAPEFRVFRTDVNPPQVVRLLPRATALAAASGTARVRGGGFAPDGSYSFFVLVRDLAGNLARAPAPDPPRASTAAAANRRRRAPPHAGGPGGARVRRVDRRRSRSGRWRAGSSSRCRGSGSERNIRRDRRRGGRAAGADTRAARTPACTWCASAPAGGARCGRWRWRACPPRPARRDRPRPLVVLPAVTWQGAQPVGLGPRRLPGHARELALDPRRAALRWRRPAAAVRAPRPRRCCGSSTASTSPTTSPPTWRWRAARGRR